MSPLRTDLALESIYTHENEGIMQSTEEAEGTLVTRISITTKEASRLVQKPMGNFVTLETKAFTDTLPEKLEQHTELLATELKKLLPKTQKRFWLSG